RRRLTKSKAFQTAPETHRFAAPIPKSNPRASVSNPSASITAPTPPLATTSKPSRRSVAQELGLAIVVVVLGGILTLYGWYDATGGRPNTFLNFDNLIDGIATPMSYYAIMAIGVTLVIITG